MKGKSLLTELAERMEKNKFVKLGVYGALIATALIIFLSSQIGSGTEPTTDSENHSGIVSGTIEGTLEETLEKRLENILSSMSGVGKVKVMITYKSTEELVIASEIEETQSETGSTSGSRPAIISGEDGENPIVVKQMLPEIQGVIVIAEGASDISIKLNIVSAASTVLGINQNRVEVFEMNKKSAED